MTQSATPPTLAGSIDQVLAAVRGQVPAPVFAQLDGIFDRLAAARVGAGAPRAGDPAPDVSFVDAAGGRVALAELAAGGPLVLMFFRGGWCVFCDLTLRAFERHADAFRAAGARLVAASPQTPEASAATGQERALSFELVTDPGNAAARAFGLVWALTEDERALYRMFEAHVDRANGNDSWELPAPAFFVIDAGRVVRWAWVDSNYTHRPEPEDVLAQVTRVAAVDRARAAAAAGAGAAGRGAERERAV